MPRPERTERQIQREHAAREVHGRFKSQNPNPRWIGEQWNYWRQMVLYMGSSREQASEAADNQIFHLPEPGQNDDDS